MNIFIKPLLSAVASVGLMSPLVFAQGEIATQGKIAAETLTYNRDLWTMSPQDVADKNPQIKWSGLSSKSANLTLWDQPIKAVTLTGEGDATHKLSYTVYDSSELNSQDSLAITKSWKALLTAKSGKRARTLTAERLENGGYQKRTMWDADDCTILLSSTENNGNQVINVEFLQKDFAKKSLIISDPDVVTDRTFYSSDYGKSFVGRLYSYDEHNKVVSVQMKANSQINPFKMDQLSEQDQAYILEMAPCVAAYRGLDFKFKEVKSKPVEKGELSITDFNYNITIRNNARTLIEDIEIAYNIYYYIGDVNKAGSDMATISGSKTVSMYPRMTDYFSTDKLELVKNIVKGKAGG